MNTKTNSLRYRFNYLLALLAFIALLPLTSWARDIEYAEEEISVRVTPGEPTQIRFPGIVLGGFKKSYSALSLEKKEGDLIVFANDKIDDVGEAIVVRLKDGRSYSVRLQKSNSDNPRDDIVKVKDKRGSIIDDREQALPDYAVRRYDQAPATEISGFMRELVLASEFGKSKIPGYQVSDQYKGDTVLNDGAISATIDQVYIGPNLWGYVLDVENMLDVGQKLNPASFRLDGTRAVSFERWELSARPLDTEQEIAGKHLTKVYIVAKAR